MKGKLTKRKLTVILASITGSVLILIAALAACSSLVLPSPSNSESESGTIQLPSHLEQSEASDSEQQTTSGTIETESTDNTESEYVGDESSSDGSTESSTESADTEAAEPSLEFTSNGNGTCSVTGIGTVTDSYVVIPNRSPQGDVVTSISEKAFYGNDTLRAIEIPSTVSNIDDMAFSACSRLVYISVDKDSRFFIDIGGILFSSDMTRLIAYPSASGASSISLPTSITRIDPMAFYNCGNLKTIDYAGSSEQWSKITVGEMNYGLYSASIICTDSAG